MKKTNTLQKAEMTADHLNPGEMPDRLTISFWIFYYLNRGRDGAYRDLERCFAELKERGFNTIRVDSGAGLCHDAAGNPRGVLEFHDAFPGCRYLRQFPRLSGGYRCDVLENTVELFLLARKYDVKVILSSWFYLHTFWYAERKIRDEFFALPVEERFMRFARDLSLILDELKRRGLIGRTAFAEIFNEFDALPLKWRMFAPDSDVGDQLHALHRFRQWHEAAIDFLRGRHPEVLFAVDTSTAEITRPEMMPGNAQVWNRHCYFAWPVYARVFEKPVFEAGFDFDVAERDAAIGPFLKPRPISMKTIREACGSDEEYEPGWYARVWLYHNLREDMIPELDRRLETSFRRELPAYRRALERAVLNSGDLHKWLLPGARMVVGEGMTYCPLEEMRWEERCAEYWELMMLNARLLAAQGCWGAMLRTNSGPEDPAWRECPEQFLRVNRAFMQGSDREPLNA